MQDQTSFTSTRIGVPGSKQGKGGRKVRGGGMEFITGREERDNYGLRVKNRDIQITTI